jgi:serine/threonine protein kinase
MTLPRPSSQRSGPRPGDLFGPYRLIEPLGQGGVALVFRAEDERSGKVVAVKSVRAPREGLLASIRREVSVLERLKHPGVVRIIEGGVSEGVPWYAMDLLEGETLRVLLRGSYASEIRPTSRGSDSSPRGTAETLMNSENVWTPRDAPLPSDRLRESVASPATEQGLAWFLTVIRRLCEPLAYVHGEGVVHRDLTPGNVFVLPGGMPVLLDFGLVWRVVGEAGRGVLSVDAARAGTVAYMAPEQARGDPVDARSDLFSLGCMMYEALTGRVPFPARSLSELIALHRAGPPPRPEQHRIDTTPPLLTELVFGLLELDPRDRIGHASNVAAVLADIGAKGWPRKVGIQPKAYLYRPRLVGRHSALKYVLADIERLKERHGGSLFVGGESGIGKTSLAFEAARRASLEGIRVITGECAAVGLAGGRTLRRSGPLYPFSSLLQAVGGSLRGGRAVRDARRPPPSLRPEGGVTGAAGRGTRFSPSQVRQRAARAYSTAIPGERSSRVPRSRRRARRTLPGGCAARVLLPVLQRRSTSPRDRAVDSDRLGLCGERRNERGRLSRAQQPAPRLSAGRVTTAAAVFGARMNEVARTAPRSACAIYRRFGSWFASTGRRRRSTPRMHIAERSALETRGSDSCDFCAITF